MNRGEERRMGSHMHFLLFNLAFLLCFLLCFFTLVVEKVKFGRLDNSLLYSVKQHLVTPLFSSSESKC